MRHVLVVDDEPGICQLVTEFLNRYGISVTSSSGVADAIGRLRHTCFDFVLTDYHMLDGTGKSVIEAARSHCPGIRLGLMTGDMAAVPTLVRDAVDHLIHKPQILAPLAGILATLGIPAQNLQA